MLIEQLVIADTHEDPQGNPLLWVILRGDDEAVVAVFDLNLN